jgi:hypothetical protein
MRQPESIEYINRSRFKLAADAQHGKEFREKYHGWAWRKTLDEYRQVS